MKNTGIRNRKVAAVPAPPMSTGRFVDLAVFVVAYEAYNNYLIETGSEATPHLKKGLSLLKRHHEDLITAIKQVFGPLVERPDAGSIRNPINLALRVSNPSEVGIAHWSKSVREVLPWIKRHPTLFGDLFTGRAARAARELASIVEEESSASLLNKLATIAPVSGLTITRKWTEEAAAAAGVPLTPTENTLVDAQVARGLGEDLGKVENALTTVPTNTPEAAELQEKRADLIQQIGAVAQQSPNPDTILAVAAQAKPPTQYATETGKKQGLTPEQEDAMMARGRVIIAAGAGSGKCIVGGTLVQTEKGLIPIENLCTGLDAEQDAVFETLVHGILGTEKTSHVYFDGFRQTRRVETTQGYELEGTAKHKILCLENGIVDWKYLQDIQVGDIVCLDRRPGLFATTPFQRTPDPGPPVRASGTSDTNVPLTLTPQVARLLGYIVSEGYIRKNVWNISLNTTDPEQMDRYRDSVQGIITHQEREDTRHRYQFILEFCRYADIQALMGFGLTREKAQEKEIPFGILQSPKHIITEFLKALFDGDGGVSGSTLGYCTASTKMAEQLHTLLLAYGIPARRRFRPNSGSGAWHIFITGKGLRRFASEIGFNLKYKQDKLEAVAARPENTNVDVIPSISHICRAVKDQYKAQYGTSKTDDPWHGTAKCIVNGSRNPSYTSLATFLEFYRVATPEWAMLDKLCKDEWFFDSVVEVAESEAHVYDFVVPGTHSFSAGGFINHNTRVIASKVAYHVTELGLPVSAILATSFTIKASAELIKRCRDYGAVIPDKTDGFGTTHSIAGRLLNKYAPDFKRPNYLGKKEGWKQTTIFRLAMDQVKMKSASSKDPPNPKGFWDDLMKGQSQSRGQGQPQLAPGTSPVAPPPPSSAFTYTKAIDDTLSYFRWAANTWSGGPGGWAKEQIPFLQDMRNADPSQLTDRQKTWLNKLFEKVKGRTFVNYRVAAGRNQGVESPDTSSESEDWSSQVIPEPKQRQNKMEEYTFHQMPANQWFNLGRELMIEDSKGNKKPIPMGEFRRAVSILKGKAISPSQAWAGEGGYEAGSDHAAVYAAYEWIKGNNGEPSFAGTGDLDDLLLDTVSALIGSPNLRQQIQSQYKVLLVDEAQDLNKIQHVLFGLMAGYLDPKTLAPWEDKHMTADTFSMIGDDFQAIYEFRGANPDEFINKSDLVEGDGDFKTKLLDTNFRSGEAIVQAANKLIAHNTKQIPKVCKANTERNGQGSIIARPCDSVEDAAETLAEEIEGAMESAMTDSAKYKNFGVAVRSNAEAYQYGVAMLKKGIPFKCNVQFFNDNNTKALIGWLTIAEKGLDGDPGLIEDAIRSAVKAPFSNLGTAFFSNLEEKARGSWARWLVNGGHSRIYAQGKWADILQHFVSNIDTVAQFTGTPSELVNKILQLKGVDGTSMQEAMIRSVTENDDLMAELAAESESGRVSEEQILEMATAPVDPLIGLMKGKENLGSAMTYVRKLRDVNSKVASRDTEDELDRDAVTIGTMHSWKGLEIQTMYIPMIGGKFPRTGKDGYSSETPELASERRLAYVAITRAEQKAVILDIPHPKHGVHSQFISEGCIPLAGTNLPDEEEVEAEENSVQKVASRWTDSAIDKLASRYLESEDE